jgi:hypothetical protein
MQAEGSSGGIAVGRKGSVIAEQYAHGQLLRFPTNEEVLKAVQGRVEATVDLCRNYRHAVWYMAFVGVYLLVLYFQVRVAADCVRLWE